MVPRCLKRRGSQIRAYRHKEVINRINKLGHIALRAHVSEFLPLVSVTGWIAHTEPLFKNLKLLKIEHILKLHELKLYYKFIHIRLPVYLQNLKLDQNSSIHNINTRGQHNIHTTRVQHEFAKHSLRYTLPRTINNTPNIILNKIYTHSLHGFSTYIKNFFIQTYNIVPCTIINCYICQ